MKKHIVFIEASSTGAGLLINKYAKGSGYFVTFISRIPEKIQPEILSFSDQVIKCDTNNLDELEIEIRKINEVRKIDGITTTADLHVPQACFLAEKLNLPGIKFLDVLSVRNKYKTRTKLDSCFPEYNPSFLVASSLEEAKDFIQTIGYPFIAKPQDGDGGLNVRLIESEEELINYFNNAAKWKLNAVGQKVAKGVLLEEYVSGIEFSIETMQSEKGKLQLIGITSKHLAGVSEGFFVEVGHSFPIKKEYSKKLFEAVNNILDCLKINCGVIHTECVIKENGEIKVMEVNPRMAGGKIGSHIIEIATGTNPTKFINEIALGKNPLWNIEYERGASIHYIWSEKKGIYNGIKNLNELKNMRGFVDIIMTSKHGDNIIPPESNYDTLGMIITNGENSDDAYLNAQKIFSNIDLIID
jgi:biotin carboxylase